MKKSLVLAASLTALLLGFQNCKPDNETVSGTERKLILPATPYDYKAEMVSFAKDLPLIDPKNLGMAVKNRKISNNHSVFIDPQGNPVLNIGFFTSNDVIINNPNGITFAPNSIANTVVKNDVATLGRVLFYDTKMSVNNTTACGNCHLQSKAFSDVAEGSSGFKGVKTSRNSMAIANPVLTRNLFWDSRSKSLQDMVLKPVQNHIEMGMEDLNYLTQKLRTVSYYPNLFKKAFGTEGITQDRINLALMQFLATMVSHNSKFDEGAKTDFANYNQLEVLGKNLFMSDKLGCNKCHSGINFSLADDVSFDNPYGGSSGAEGTANIGLDMVYKDNGKGSGKFKIPSLRNIALTAPYMHDGRFKSLEEVVEHYNNGIKGHPNLDTNLKDDKGQPKQLNLSSLEKSALLAFLQTLTDTKYTTDPKYSDPFKQ